MYGRPALWCVCLLAALLGACAGSPRASAGARAGAARRVVVLMPSFAQDLCAIGAGARIAGVSQYGSSAGCASRAPQVANFSSLDAEKIVALRADAVVAIPAQRALTAPLRRAGIRIVYLNDDGYADIFSDIARLGNLVGEPAAARRLSARLRARTRALQASEHFKRRPRVFVVLQSRPIWTVGPSSYISTLLRLAGARNAVTRLPRPYAQYDAEALLQLQPDAIVATKDTQLRSQLGREPWRSLRAVREHRVFILENPDVLERPGPYYNEGISWLIRHLRPLAE